MLSLLSASPQRAHRQSVPYHTLRNEAEAYKQQRCAHDSWPPEHLNGKPQDRLRYNTSPAAGSVGIGRVPETPIEREFVADAPTLLRRMDSHPQNTSDDDDDVEHVYIVSSPEASSEEEGWNLPAPDANADDAVAVLRGHSSAVYAVAITGQDEVVISGGGDDRALVWVQPFSEAPRLLGDFHDSVSAVALTGSRLALGTLAGELQVHCTQQLTERTEGEQLAPPLAQVETDVGIECLRGNSEFFAAGTADGALWVLDALSGDCLGVAYNHQGAINSLAFVQDDTNVSTTSLLVTASTDGTVRLWGPPSHGTVPCLYAMDGVFHDAPVLSLASFRDVVLSGDESGRSFLANWRTGRVLCPLSQQHQGSVESVVASPEFLVTGGSDGFLHVYTPDARYRMSFQHRDVVVVVRETKRWSQCFVSASVDQTVCLWDLRSGAEPVRCWRGHCDAILTMDIGTELIVTGSDDATVRCFPLQ